MIECITTLHIFVGCGEKKTRGRGCEEGVRDQSTFRFTVVRMRDLQQQQCIMLNRAHACNQTRYSCMSMLVSNIHHSREPSPKTPSLFSVLIRKEAEEKARIRLERQRKELGLN